MNLILCKLIIDQERNKKKVRSKTLSANIKSRVSLQIQTNEKTLISSVESHNTTCASFLCKMYFLRHVKFRIKYCVINF